LIKNLKLERFCKKNKFEINKPWSTLISMIPKKIKIIK
jgi:hypothetical protein